MKYRHRYHAGNFADVHKHVALLALVHALQRKDKGFLYLDTHAGAGAYQLANRPGHPEAEPARAATALMNAAEPRAPELRAYREAVRAWRRSREPPLDYPGSPALVAQALRPQDRAACFERLPSECRSLQRALGSHRQLHIECADGYQRLRAWLPPRERRSLLLIDPPYENSADEMRATLAAIVASLARLANGLIAVWYPIKDARSLLPWQQQLANQLSVPALDLQLWLYPPDSRVALNGSGLIVINPPYQFEPRTQHWQQELCAILDTAGRAGSAVRTLAPGRPAAASHPRHAGA